MTSMISWPDREAIAAAGHETTPRYIDSLTPLRGVAALWVVAYHFDEVIVRLTPPSTGIISRGYLWVDFFFLLSGFIICHVYGDRFLHSRSAGDVRRYVVARFSRIYPLHLFTLLLMVGLWTVATHFEPEIRKSVPAGVSFTYATIPQNVALVHAHGTTSELTWNVPSWSIAAEWWTYLVALPLITLLHARGRGRGWAAIVAGLCGLAVMEQLHADRDLDITFDYGWLRCLFGFVIGMGLNQLFRDGVGERVLRRDGAFVALAVAIGALFHRTVADVLVIPVFAMLLLAAAYNGGRTRQVLATRPMRFLGDTSYSIYLWQAPCLLMLWGGVMSLGVADETGTFAPSFPVRLLLFAIAVTMIIGFAALTYRYVELPARTWLRRWAR